MDEETMKFAEALIALDKDANFNVYKQLVDRTYLSLVKKLTNPAINDPAFSVIQAEAIGRVRGLEVLRFTCDDLKSKYYQHTAAAKA